MPKSKHNTKQYNISGTPQKAKGWLRKTFDLARYDKAMENAISEEHNLKFVHPRSMRNALANALKQHRISEAERLQEQGR